jgi:metallo-beta-lactamase class B
MRRMTRRCVLAGLGLLAVLTLLCVGRSLNANKVGGQGPAEPFRIAGNFYYVGATDASAFLITGPEGHIVIDAGYPTTAKLVIASIAKLGFDIRDVKVLLNSEPHPDHGGGLAVLQQASGARLYSSDASAVTLAAGGDDPDAILPLRALVWLGLVGYPPPRVDHRFKDGDTIRVGTIAVTAHITAGHTRGCTSWSFTVRDAGRDDDRLLDVVSACDMGVLATSTYPEQAADRKRSLQRLRSLPADIWVTAHARWWGRYRKFVASQTAERPSDAFVDPAGYRAFIDAAEAEFRSGRTH